MSRNNCRLHGIRAGFSGLAILALAACSGTSSGDASGGATSTAIGGSSAAGGSNSGGASNTTSNTGSSVIGGSANTGGASPTGGVSPAGGAPSTGGVSPTGGSRTASGGAPSTGGVSPTGGLPSTGGSKNTGGIVGTGGVSTSGGKSSTGGTTATGGKSSTGGSPATGGATSTNSACPGADASEFALIQSWLNNTAAVGALPAYAYTNIKSNFPAGAAFDKLACSIAMSCVEFAPMESNWLRKCEALLTSAIVAESSYNPTSVVNSPATDPTVGLLQIRFSSTVHDYNYYGPMAKMAAIGCTWPSALLTQADTSSFWTSNGPNNLSFMQDPACNIGLAAWYYLYNATGNGGASNSNVVWISDYCAGRGIAGNMLYGFDSHLDGGGAITRSGTAGTLSWSNLAAGSGDLDYPWGIECCACGNPAVCTCTGCSGRFAAFMGIGTTAAHPSPDPFLETLAPEPTKFCK